MTNPFYRLAPFIQEYIYREKWGELRPVQVKAIGTILDTPNHVLITSRTASGKTEAAFLPILTRLYEDPPASIGVVYIGPLKALINDQFYRLQGLLEDSGIPVQSWHGDVPQSRKTKFLRQAQGVLQITPESLEAMLIRRQTELGRLFGDLRFVIIDEIHALISSDRGRQILCQLQRLARYQAQPARRIGLSATVGEPELMRVWLAGGTTLPTEHVDDAGGRREVQLGLEHFICADEQNERDEEISSNQPASLLSAPEHTTEESNEAEALFEHMSQLVKRVRKTLIFANSRNATEEIIHNLRWLAGIESDDEDGYYVHHGSISAALREKAEADMRDPNKLACIAATVTLELGIDIGNLDQVLQLNATNTVSSFVQRLGRSGRRGNAASMFFYSREDRQDSKASLGKRIPWGLLQTIAIIQLYLEEKWLEPPELPQLPVSLLYHQTMSVLTAQTELTPAQLAGRVLTLSPFASVTFDHYRALLRHLLATEHLEQIEAGGLIIGLAGERIVNNYRFYATFQDEIAYLVREGSREIGSIQSLPAIGDRFMLAGRSWAVLDIDDERRVIQVERVKGKAPAYWLGGGAVVHTRILERMRQILEEDTEYSYLHPKALQRLNSARHLAKMSDMTRGSIVELGGDRYLLLPWQGTRVMTTIELLLQHAGVHMHRSEVPFFFEIEASSSKTLRQQLSAVVDSVPDPQAVVATLPRRMVEQNKYDRYVPDDLLQAAFAADYLDIAGAITALETVII